MSRKARCQQTLTRVDQPRCRAPIVTYCHALGVRIVGLFRVCGRLFPVEHAVVADDGSDAQAIVVEEAAATGALGAPMLLQRPPVCDRSFVPEERQRQDLARLREALKPLDREKPSTSLSIGFRSAAMSR